MDEGTTINSMGFTPDRPMSTPPKGGKGKLIAIIITALLIGGGIFLFVKNSQKSKQAKTENILPTETPAPTEAPTETPTATSSATPTKKPSSTPIPTTGVISSALDMNVQVLNGSGVVGAAGDVASFLKGKGYKHITTDNADNYDYKNVTVNIKTSRNNFLDTLVSALKEKYTVASSSGTVAESSSIDAQVIVGK